MNPSPRPERTIPGRLIVLPMLVFAATVVAIAAYWLFTQPKRPPPPPPSIVVLPFDAQDRETGDQVALGVMQKLGGIPGFRVISKEEAFPLKGTDVEKIGERLNVRSVLEGSVQQTGDRLQVNARLFNTSDGYQFWSKTYIREAKDLAGIEDEISKSVMQTLDLKPAR